MLSQREVAGQPSGRHRAEESALRKRILRLGVELRLRARSRLAGERDSHTFQTTAPVEALKFTEDTVLQDRRLAKVWLPRRPSGEGEP